MTLHRAENSSFAFARSVDCVLSQVGWLHSERRDIQSEFEVALSQPQLLDLLTPTKIYVLRNLSISNQFFLALGELFALPPPGSGSST